MNLLPSEQKERIEQAIETFEKTGSFSIFEPCDCGNQIRHNNGGNYHTQIYLRRDSGKFFIKDGSTCKLVPPAQWEEIDQLEVAETFQENADWL